MKTPGSRSSALLRRVTSADHRRGALADVARLRRALGDGFFIAPKPNRPRFTQGGNAGKIKRVPY